MGDFFADRGWRIQVDIHDVEVADGGSNPHVHMMVSACKMFSVGFAKRKARELERMSRGDFGNWIKRQVDELLEKAAGIKLLNPMRPSTNERQTHSQQTADPTNVPDRKKSYDR